MSKIANNAEHLELQDENLPAVVRVCAVVVTYNRKALLQECLSAIRAQTRSVDAILVVNNASTDGTQQMLDEEFSDCRRLDLPVNVGGAGGFYEGIKWAYQHGYDWFWCMDDDTIAFSDCLEKLTASPYFLNDSTGFLASLVRWRDGSVHKMNISRPATTAEWYNTVLDDKCVPVTTTSFVSALISRAAVAKVGLPIKEFFIWHDDVEYTYRISKYFAGYCVLDSVVVHKTASNQGADLRTCDPSDYPKYVYGLRNEIVYLKLEKGRVLGKVVRITLIILNHAEVILKRRAPLNLFLAMFKGILFSPRIHFIEAELKIDDSKVEDRMTRTAHL